MLEAAGATTLRLAALDIKPVDGSSIALRSTTADAFALIIFTSANAVHFGAPLLDRLRGYSLAAIGPATARALGEAGHRVTVAPVDGFDSESLLRHPELNGLAGRRVLIVKGMRGREVLREELTRRGAWVETAEVYERERPPHSAAKLAATAEKLRDGAIQVVTATSADVATSLLEMATPTLRRELDRVHWLVPGARVAAEVRRRGVMAPLLQADSAEDQDLVAALIRWRADGDAA